MYAVILRAQINQIDDEYFEEINKLSQLAREQYHCVSFHAVRENGVEISISYWNSLGDMQAWRHDLSHQLAKQTGVWKWYSSYQVEVTEIMRQYERSNLS